MARTLKTPALKGDRVIWIVAVFLALASMLAVYTAISTYAGRLYNDNTSLAFIHHLATLVTALILMFIAHHIPSKIYCNLSTFLLLISIPLLILTLLKGSYVNGASRALRISLGFASMTVQTSEFAKVFLLNYIAAHLYFLKDKLHNIKVVVIWFFLPISIIVGLVMPPNMSMALMIMLDSMVLLLVGGIKLKHMLGFAGIILVFGSIYIGYKLTLPPEAQGRVGTWKGRLVRYVSKPDATDSSKTIDPFDDYHRQQTCSKIAISTGGFIGKGSGHSQQRNFLSHAYSDFIYAIIIEEYGLLGGSVIIILYLIIMSRGFITLKKHKDSYGGLLVFGLAFMIVVQAFVNMCVAVALVPVTGQPLPFISMGGSSLWAIGIAFGMMLSATRNLDHENEKELEKENPHEDNDETEDEEQNDEVEYIVNVDDNGEPIIVASNEE